jgi:F5/8 type C domain/Protein of unknown function (DUF1565)
MIRNIKFLLFVCFVLMCCKILATTYYVSPSGNDSNPGSFSEPWKTIAYALTYAGPDVTVMLRSGTYNEGNLLLNKGGTAGNNFALRSYFGETAIIDGGGGTYDYGLKVDAPYQSISYLKIANFKLQGINIKGYPSYGGTGAHNITIEKNIIYNIGSLTGVIEGAGIWGVYGIKVNAVSDCVIQYNTIYRVNGHNESFGIHFDIQSSKEKIIKNVKIERNLLYHIDKAGIRLCDNGVFDERYQVVQTPILIRWNISIHNGFAGLELNYIGPNNATPGDDPAPEYPGTPSPVPANAKLYLHYNFSGWNLAYGANIKHTHNYEIRNNNFYKNSRTGYYTCGGVECRNGNIYNNIFYMNSHMNVDIDLPGINNLFAGNYHRALVSGNDFFRDKEVYPDNPRFSTLSAVQAETKHEDYGILDNADIFIDPANGNFNLITTPVACPAIDSAIGGDNFGINPLNMNNIGATKSYNLSNIPILPELQLEVIGYSSQADDCPLWISENLGYAANLVDKNRATSWITDGGNYGWIKMEIAGPSPVEIRYFVVAEYAHLHQANIKDFKLFSSNDGSTWTNLGRFTRYIGGAGQVFALPAGTYAKYLMLEIRSNHGDSESTQVAEFKVYKNYNIR